MGFPRPIKAQINYWSAGFIMCDIQNNILEVIKQRAKEN